MTYDFICSHSDQFFPNDGNETSEIIHMRPYLHDALFLILIGFK